MSQDAPVSVVIVGHVDHGKSTFIGRFLFDTKQLSLEKMAELESQTQGVPVDFAHVMDQFKEEREKNITIDTAQTFFALNNKPYIFVDAPGHKEYLKNMITGATQARNAMLLLDMNEGIREQTQKHVQILKMLGISRFAVLLNKMDLVQYQEKAYNEAKQKLEALLEKNGMSAQWFIPISAKEGDNVVTASEKLAWYKGPTAKEAVLQFEPDRIDLTNAPLRFPIQLRHETKSDHYLMGRIEMGKISKGQTLTCFPGGETLKAKKILIHPDKLKEASAGQSIAIEIDKKNQMNRGMVLCEEGSAQGANAFSGPMFWASLNGVQVGDQFDVECRAQTAVGTLKSMKDPFSGEAIQKIESGDIVHAEIELSTPMVLDMEPLESPFRQVVFQRKEEPAGCAVIDQVQKVSV